MKKFIFSVMKSTRHTGSLAFKSRLGCSVTFFSYCAGMKIISDAKFATPSLEREVDFYLGRGSRFGRSIQFNSRISVVSSCTGTQRNETLTNCITTPCMDVKTIGIPLCTGTPGQPQNFFISFVMELWDCCDLLCFMH